MAELWFVRHGETDFNIVGRYCGSTDAPLNAHGLEQAEALAQTMAGKKFDVIFSSDLCRAYVTAQATAQVLAMEINVDPRLREINQGEWEGMFYTDIVKQMEAQLQEKRENPLYFRPPQGETLVEVIERVSQAVDDIARAYPAGKILIFSHGLAIATQICRFDGKPYEMAHDLIPANATPVVFEYLPVEEPAK
ncbi:MAG: histidine phosphatase family protein [Chloroflexi bacterium]|nr:histidine phosphatase family protein [Chloroflexota bacterium]